MNESKQEQASERDTEREEGGVIKNEHYVKWNMECLTSASMINYRR